MHAKMVKRGRPHAYAIQCRNSVLTGWKRDCPGCVTRCVQGKCGRGDLDGLLGGAECYGTGGHTARHSSHMSRKSDRRVVWRRIDRRRDNRCGARLLDNLPVRHSLLCIERQRHDRQCREYQANYNTNASHHRTPVFLQILSNLDPMGNAAGHESPAAFFVG
jgi:hypothetical protein